MSGAGRNPLHAPAGGPRRQPAGGGRTAEGPAGAGGEVDGEDVPAAGAAAHQPVRRDRIGATARAVARAQPLAGERAGVQRRRPDEGGRRRGGRFAEPADQLVDAAGARVGRARAPGHFRFPSPAAVKPPGLSRAAATTVLLVVIAVVA